MCSSHLPSDSPNSMAMQEPLSSHLTLHSARLRLYTLEYEPELPYGVRQTPSGLSSWYCSEVERGALGVAQRQPSVSGGKGGGAGDGG